MSAFLWQKTRKNETFEFACCLIRGSSELESRVIGAEVFAGYGTRSLTFRGGEENV